MKVLQTKYHSQRNNAILPFVTCGTTSLANQISWLNIKYGTNFECDDDKVLEILNSPPMIERAKILIKQGAMDSSALSIRLDNPLTPDVDESKFTHLNNFKQALAECGTFITNGMFLFKVSFMSPDEIKTSIDNDVPYLISGMFTKSGHYILVVGYDDNGDLIVDDPYGDWRQHYSDPDVSGAKLPYSIKGIDAIVTEWFRKGDKWEGITVIPNFESKK